MTTPENLMFTKTHEWVKETQNGTFLIGLSDFAQKELGDLVFVNLPEAGDQVNAGEPFGDVESVKAVSEVFCPVSGTVRAANDELLDAPEKINGEPYEAWMIEVENVSDKEELLNAGEYEKFCESQS